MSVLVGLMIEGAIITKGTRSGLAYRNPRPEWAGELEALERSSFPTSDPEDLYCKEDLEILANDFPQGGFVGFDNEKPVAMGLGIQVLFDEDNPLHTVHDVMPGNGDSGHRPNGDWYYGTSIAVRSEYRRRGIGAELYELRKDVCRSLNLRGIVAGGVMPEYVNHKHEMTADEYIEQVREQNIYDPTLSFQQENGFELVRALPNYIMNPDIDNYAALIIWRNNDFRSQQ